MDANLLLLAHYVRTESQEEGYRHLAARCGIQPKKFNFVYRAANPGKELPGGRILNPVLSESLLKLLTELRLTFAPVDDSVPTVAHICMMIGRLEGVHPVAKVMAIDAVHRAGMVREVGDED